MGRTDHEWHLLGVTGFTWGSSCVGSGLSLWLPLPRGPAGGRPDEAEQGVQDETTDGPVQPHGGPVVRQTGSTQARRARGQQVDPRRASPMGGREGTLRRGGWGRGRAWRAEQAGRSQAGCPPRHGFPFVAPVPRKDMQLPGCLEVGWQLGVTAPSQQPSRKVGVPGSERWEHHPPSGCST